MKTVLNEKINYDLITSYDVSYLREYTILPFFDDGLTLYLYVSEDSNLNTCQEFFNNKNLKFLSCEKEEILFLLSDISTKLRLFSLAGKSKEFDSLNSSFMQDFLEKLLSYSIEKNSSDIHIESCNNLTLFRFRIDGNLKTFLVLEKNFIKLVSSYLKLISNLDITQNRLPLDSRFSFLIDAKKFDFRLSTMPTLEAESIVIRVLDSKNINIDINKIGFSSHILLDIQNALKLTQGLILVTGPTGSGKTTTLYSMLNILNSNEKKIITIEDPIEYKLENITQVQVNNKIGLNFDLVLRNILRQDPDIIFIGEIRDELSLQIALQASLTGHLVLASIHANNSSETITRLYDLKADPFLISTTLKLVLSQRLVLSYCKYCQAKGCSKCNFTKYKGRTIISEALKIDESLSSMIFKKQSINTFNEYLRKIKHRSLYDDGKLKVKENITSMEELLKVIGL
ncbi:GspE/PulE family protein [Arcobacter roscoffensis]|uniref:GspE/PulE family protein n=1 Tax=Arcobacter roscoffensis TaxID=2961520 RepID=A0ABY5E569_9BACT|nr:GspE/PulE family protein [Arcobacter roscoffensis]UTJ05873.1 GspE/PulE family protein [Arcobacter roscoffensis]